jgi:hypothetical protein
VHIDGIAYIGDECGRYLPALLWQGRGHMEIGP